MILLNLGCGGSRPSLPWLNIDNLYTLFPDPACPERVNMDSEGNYLNHDLRNGIPFKENSVDGIVASHLLEHLDCHEAIQLLKECHRALKAGGVLRVSLPDPAKFYSLTMAGCTDWGEPMYQKDSFMEYALAFHDHKQFLGKDGLYCMLWLSGFKGRLIDCAYQQSTSEIMATLDTRPVFSLFVEALK